MQNDKSSTKILLYLNKLYPQTTKNKGYQTKTEVAHRQREAFSKTFQTMGSKQQLKQKQSSKYKTKQHSEVMQKNIYQRLEYYQQSHKVNQIKRQLNNKMIQMAQNQKILKSKPNINRKSQKLYEKRKNQRELSPNVFNRLIIDQEQRSIQKIESTVKRIKEVTPLKILNINDLLSFTTPKEIKYLSKQCRTEVE